MASLPSLSLTLKPGDRLPDCCQHLTETHGPSGNMLLVKKNTSEAFKMKEKEFDFDFTIYVFLTGQGIKKDPETDSTLNK